ncbi:MAG: hypothetical protein A2X18_07555 [Bacteroidetes bacterium GWF2_40_14]|nr:MAG: hypothetical protein A2X18_07555 [Bacteroidetes bacterium GWF2_40_14]
MEKQLGKKLSQNERIALLQDNCSKVEPQGYMRSFTEDEIAEKKDQLADQSIELNNIQDEKKAAMDKFKIRMKPISTNISKLLLNIKNKAEYVTEDLYKFIDLDEKMVGYYDSDGKLVDSLTRRARPDELQGTIFHIPRTGTHS